MLAAELLIIALLVSRIGLDLRSMAKGGTSWRMELAYGVLFSASAVVMIAADQSGIFALASVAGAVVSFGLAGLKWLRLKRSTP
jgi:hypothetical protein